MLLRNQHKPPFLRGGRIIYLKGPYLQRGRGLGSFLSSVARKGLPFLRSAGRKILTSPIVQDVGKSLMQTAATGGLELAVDALKGKKNAKESLGKTVEQAKENIASVIKAHSKRKREEQELKKNTPKKRRRKALKTVFDESDSDTVESDGEE